MWQRRALELVEKSSGCCGFCSSFGHGLETMQNSCKVEEHAAMPSKVFSLIFSLSIIRVGVTNKLVFGLRFMGVGF